MSGGHYDYIQFNIQDVVAELKKQIKRIKVANNTPDPEESWLVFNNREAVLEEFELCRHHLELGALLLNRIDWLVSGDDGEEAFLQRINTEVRDYLEASHKESDSKTEDLPPEHYLEF